MKKEEILFQKYFNHTLTEEEIQIFINELSQNEQLNQQFNLYKLAHYKTMEILHPKLADRRQKIKQDLKSFRQSPTQKTRTQVAPVQQIKSRKIRFYQWLSAASILLLVVAGLFIFSQPSYDPSLAIKETEKYMYAVNLNGLAEVARSTTNTNQVDQLQAIQEKNFRAITRLYNNAVHLEEDNLLTLVKGIAYYQDKELEKAKEQFEKLTKEGKGQVDIAQWALATVYLKQGEVQKARSVLATIKTPTDVKAKKVLELLPK